MITGIHAIVHSRQAEEVGVFFRDVLGWESVDAGHGWLMFAAPPTELAVHPAEEGSHDLYLMCDDLDGTAAQSGQKGVSLARPIHEESWGRVTALQLPGGSVLGLYEPRHPTALELDHPR